MADNPWWQGLANGFGSKQGANALIGLGTGLLQGNTFAKGLAAGGQGFMQGAELDQQYADEAEKKANEALKRSQTIDYLRGIGAEQYAAAVGAGVMDGGDAFSTYQADQRSASERAAELDRARANAQFISDPTLRSMVEGGALPFEDAYKYQMDGSEAPAAPNGYEWITGPNGRQLQYITGGPADPALAAANKPATDAERRGAALTSVVDSDAALLLGDGTNPGVFEQLADSGDQFWNVGAMGVNPLKGLASGDYQKAANAVENIAQSYLYAISGQAAPAAEVEKIVNSITPRPFENPVVLAEKKRRLEEYVNAIRMSAGNHAPGGGNAGDGWEVIGVQ